MVQKSKRLLFSWSFILIVLCLFGFLVNTAIFYPGYMSADTIRYLNQASGASPFIDLQPVIFPVVWKFLIFLTGKVSSMFVLQLLMLWAGVLLFSRHIYDKTGRRSVSLIPVGCAFLPFVINISGVIWSDVHLAFSLFLSLILILYIKEIRETKPKTVVFFVSYTLILYAGMVRSNSLIPVVPLLYLLVSQYFEKYKLIKKIVVSFALFLLIIISAVLVKVIFAEKHITNTAGPMMDDIVHMLRPEEIGQMELPAELKQSLMTFAKCSREDHIIIDPFPCGAEQDKTNVLIKYPSQVSALWKDTLIRHPLRYLERRVTVFVYVIFPPEGRGYIWHAGVDQNNYGIRDRFEGLSEINRMYVFNFGYKHFQYLYEPWFWLFANIFLVFYAKNLKRYKMHVYSSSSSALLYIATFIPTGVAADYRYIYWPVIASLFSITLLIVDRNSKRSPAIGNVKNPARKRAGKAT